MVAPGAPPNVGDTSLGSIGQESTDPLERLFRQSSPNVQLPSWIRCPARRNPSARQIGITRCKNLFCPNCHGERQKQLEHRLLKFFEIVQSSGYGMSFITVTLPHRKKQTLVHCADILTEAWKVARDGKPVRRLKATHGLLGVVTVDDATWGDDGWHYHAHAIVVAETAEAAQVCASVLGARFEKALERRGLVIGASTVHVEPVSHPAGVAGYLSKSWHLPQRGGGATPFHLLNRALSGSPEAFDLFLEAVEAFRGRKRGVISRALTRALQRGQPGVPSAVVNVNRLEKTQSSKVGRMRSSEFKPKSKKGGA